jgi:tetratricopeptide (TPR) repeat protein
MKLSVNRQRNSLVLAMCIALAMAGIFVPRAAAQLDGVISGQILDITGKPWADMGIQAVSEQGQKSETKTDSSGNFTIHGLRNGVYTVSVILPAPNKPYDVKIRVTGADTPKVNLNFKDIAAKQGAEYAEAQKKQEEQKQKFQGMKQHFDAGVGFLNQVGQAKADLAKAPADQRDTLKQQVKDLSEKAVGELEQAKAGAPEKDQNLHLIWARLADAYDSAGRSDDAVNAYKQAIELKPSAAYYNNLGGILGRSGKIQEAMEAYQKSAELDPANAAQAYRNGGITLYNAGKLKEAVEPLKKATELDPKNAQAWYLLGAALVYNMTTKRVGNKEEVVFAPGTIEAYQKAIDLDPNGTYGQQAKLGLEQLQQMAPGIEIKTTAKKKKS